MLPRIHIIEDGCGNPYMLRYTLAELLGREVKLHIMLRSDDDREMHDHPWGFWSLVLSGGYDEEVPANQINPTELPCTTSISRDTWQIARAPGQLDYRAPEWRHRVILRPMSRGEAMFYQPWPVGILRWLGRFGYFRRLPDWEKAIRAIDSQYLNNLRISCTLVVTTKRVRTWGFWREGKFIPHDQFTSSVDC